MNLFSFDGPKFTVSKEFWIFVVLAVPLTLLTLGSWYMFTRRRLLRRKLKGRSTHRNEKGYIETVAV